MFGFSRYTRCFGLRVALLWTLGSCLALRYLLKYQTSNETLSGPDARSVGFAPAGAVGVRADPALLPPPIRCAEDEPVPAIIND